MSTTNVPAPTRRFRVQVEEGSPHGGLYELEVDTTYRVVDEVSRETVMSFSGGYAASFGDDGRWGDPVLSGVVAVTVDGTTVVVRHADGRVEVHALPG